MKMRCNEMNALRTRWVQFGAVLAFALIVLAERGTAQAAAGNPSFEEPKHAVSTYRTIYLNNVSDQRDANEILSDLRNMLPMSKIYLVSAPNEISMRGPAEDVEEAQKIVSDLDRPRKAYRLTYTLAEVEGGKRTTVQRYSLVAISGEKAEFKQGSRIPVVTGTSQTTQGESATAQVQYIDVGLNITAWLNGSADGLRLHSKVENSNQSEEKSGVGTQDPVVRQTMLETMSMVVLGKPVVLGSLDLPGTEKHLEIEIVPELVHY